MTALRIEFLARRYQATPWEHHVNEGLVEWPPSPWRLLRALLATGYTKLGWGPGAPPPTARSLIERLCSTLPEYALPSVTYGHTRHYMPLGEHERGEAKTTKVFDTFALLTGAEPHLWVRWPISLPPVELDELARLASHLGYLGRAESWVEAHAVAHWPSDVRPNVVPADRAEGSSGDLLELLAAESPEHYQAWRNAAFEGALAQLGADGKKPSAKQRAAMVERFPSSIMEALCTDTTTVQRHGWSRAPGARWRPFRVLACREARAAARGSSPVATVCPTFVVIALFSDTQQGTVRPLLNRALEVGVLTHRTVLSRARDESEGASPEIVGKQDGTRLAGHMHAHYLPIDLDGDGRIDHVLAWCPATFTAASYRAMTRIERIWDKDAELVMHVNVVAAGDAKDLQSLRLRTPMLQRSRSWETWTPFVCPRYAKPRGNNSVEGQVRAELQARGLPQPESVEIWSRERARERRLFRFDCVRPQRPPPVAAPMGITLHFAEEVSGPLALGYGSHYGLGVFVPSTDARPMSMS